MDCEDVKIARNGKFELFGQGQNNIYSYKYLESFYGNAENGGKKLMIY